MSKINDVARLAGVSPSTVSRALSKKVFVKKETRQRVLQAALELNYHPSMTAKSLREGKSYAIALLVPEISGLFYPELTSAIEQRVSKSGYLLFLCSSHNSFENEKRTIELLANRGIDGICCVSVEDEFEHLVQFQKTTGIPVVMMNRSDRDCLSYVTVDNVDGGHQATKYLLDRGHRRIAGLFGDFSIRRYWERSQGYRMALEEKGVQLPDFYRLTNITSSEEAYCHAKKILRSENPPTAFFASADILAVGIYHAASEVGLRIPEDISVVGFDNISLTEHMTPSLTSYCMPVEEIAEESISMLLHQIEFGVAPASILLKGKVVERNSVQPLG